MGRLRAESSLHSTYFQNLLHSNSLLSPRIRFIKDKSFFFLEIYFCRCLSSSSFHHSKQENLGVVEGGGEWEEVEGFGGESERGAEKLGGLLAGLYLTQGPTLSGDSRPLHPEMLPQEMQPWGEGPADAGGGV